MWTKLFKESKNIGVLYHVCSLNDFCDYIVPTDELDASGEFQNKLLNRSDVISFSRDKYYMVKTIKNLSSGSKVFLQICVDGELLSENKKIIPYNDLVKTGGKGEAEECVIAPIKKFKRFITAIHFDFYKYELTSNDAMLIRKALNYYKNITYFHFNKKLGVNPFNLEEGDSIVKLDQYIPNATTIPKALSDYLFFGVAKTDDEVIKYTSKKEQLYDIQYLCNEYNVSLDDMFFKGQSVYVWLLYYLISTNNETVKNRLEATIDNLKSLGVVYKTEYEKEAIKNVDNKKLENYVFNNLIKMLNDNADYNTIVEFIDSYLNIVSHLIESIFGSYIINNETIDLRLVKYLLTKFNKQLVSIGFLRNSYEEGNYKVVNLILNNGLLENKQILDQVLSVLNRYHDFENCLKLLRDNKNIDVFDDKYFDVINSIYTNAIKENQYELVSLILDMGFSERLKYDIPYNEFIKFSNGNKKMIALADVYR